MEVARPTSAQAEAGNYKMGHMRIHGLEISIETPRGRSRRPGRWPRMAAHYGYIRRTTGKDGDHVDVFVGPHPDSQLVIVIDQVDQAGAFDEHKVMLGYTTKEAAIAAYRKCYTPGWRVGQATAMTIDQFKAWLEDGTQHHPVGDQVSKFSATPIPPCSEWTDEYRDHQLALTQMHSHREAMGWPGQRTTTAQWLEQYTAKQLGFQWKEEDHPRDDAGKFAEKQEASKPIAIAKDAPAKQDPEPIEQKIKQTTAKGLDRKARAERKNDPVYQQVDYAIKAGIDPYKGYTVRSTTRPGMINSNKDRTYQIVWYDDEGHTHSGEEITGYNNGNQVAEGIARKLNRELGRRTGVMVKSQRPPGEKWKTAFQYIRENRPEEVADIPRPAFIKRMEKPFNERFTQKDAISMSGDMEIIQADDYLAAGGESTIPDDLRIAIAKEANARRKYYGRPERPITDSKEAYAAWLMDTVEHYTAQMMLWDEAEHPRDAIGRFAEKDTAGGSKPVPSALRQYPGTIDNGEGRQVDRPPVYLTGKSTNETREAAKDLPNLGVLITPKTAQYTNHLDDYHLFGVDNGCFSGPFDERAFYRLLERIKASGNAHKALFATAPDVFDPEKGMGDWEKTLESSLPHLDRIRAAGFPAAIVLQDGATPETVPWDQVDALFVGGSDAFKLAVTPKGTVDMGMIRIAREAKRRGIPIHFGRVNSAKRLEITHFGLNGASVDGTFLNFGEAGHQLERIKSWLTPWGKFPDKKDKPKVSPMGNTGEVFSKGIKRKGVIEFEPITGPSGAQLVAYEWKHEKIEEVDSRGELRTKKVSNWEEALESHETGRKIVHTFTMITPKGEPKVVSLESALEGMGYLPGSDGAKHVQTLAGALKSQALARMAKSQLEKLADDLRDGDGKMTQQEQEAYAAAIGSRNWSGHRPHAIERVEREIDRQSQKIDAMQDRIEHASKAARAGQTPGQMARDAARHADRAIKAMATDEHGRERTSNIRYVVEDALEAKRKAGKIDRDTYDSLRKEFRRLSSELFKATERNVLGERSGKTPITDEVPARVVFGSKIPAKPAHTDRKLVNWHTASGQQAKSAADAMLEFLAQHHPHGVPEKYAANETEASGHWITIGADKSQPKGKQGGAHVFIDGKGEIKKGPANLEGKQIGQLDRDKPSPAPPHQSLTEPQKRAEIKPGHEFEIHPKIPSYTSWNKLKITGESNGEYHVAFAEDGNQHTQTKVPSLAINEFVNDLRGEIKLESPAGDARIQAVADGKAEFLGKGNDGLAYAVGNEVVKASTAVPFVWSNYRGMLPGQARDNLKKSVEINEQLRQAGVPGLLRQEYKEAGSKGFAIMPRLSIPEKYTPQQLEAIKDTITKMHDAGYTVGDEIQAGIAADGKPYIFDIGQARELGDGQSKQYALDDDRGRVRRLYEDAGLDPPYWPDEAAKKYHHHEYMAQKLAKPDKEYPAGFMAANLERLDEAFEALKKWDPDHAEFVEDMYQQDRAALAAKIGKAEPPKLPAGTKSIERHVAEWTPEQKQSDWKKNGTAGGAFKSWFGDWEHDHNNSSKVIDDKTREPKETSEISGQASKVMKDGKPLVMYHGTGGGSFDAFEKRWGEATGAKSEENLLYGPGMYFTESQEIAGEYSQIKKLAFNGDIEQLRAAARQQQEWAAKNGDGIVALNLKQSTDVLDRMTAEQVGAPANKDQEIAVALLKKWLPVHVIDSFWTNQSSPHVFQTYLNVRKPFDADKSVPEDVLSVLTPEQRAKVEEPIRQSEQRIAEQEKYIRDGRAAIKQMKQEHDRATDPRIKADLKRAKEEYESAIQRAGTQIDYFKERVARGINYSAVAEQLGGKAAMNEALRKAGYDGITHVGGMRWGAGKTDPSAQHRVWIAFEPNQIKSTDNQGTFDPKDDRMQYAAPKESGQRWITTDNGQHVLIDSEGRVHGGLGGNVSHIGGKSTKPATATKPAGKRDPHGAVFSELNKRQQSHQSTPGRWDLPEPPKQSEPPKQEPQAAPPEPAPRSKYLTPTGGATKQWEAAGQKIRDDYDKEQADREAHPHHLNKLPDQIKRALLNWHYEAHGATKAIEQAAHGARASGGDPVKAKRDAWHGATHQTKNEPDIEQTRRDLRMKPTTVQIEGAKDKAIDLAGRLQKMIKEHAAQGVDVKPFIKHNNLIPRPMAAKLKPNDSLFRPVTDDERFQMAIDEAISEQYAAKHPKNSPGQLGMFGDGLGGNKPLRSPKTQQKMRWITIHPNGPGTKGTHVMIDKDGTIQAGAGGKLNGMKLGNIHSEEAAPPKAKHEWQEPETHSVQVANREYKVRKEGSQWFFARDPHRDGWTVASGQFVKAIEAQVGKQEAKAEPKPEGDDDEPDRDLIDKYKKQGLDDHHSETLANYGRKDYDYQKEVKEYQDAGMTREEAEQAAQLDIRGNDQDSDLTKAEKVAAKRSADKGTEKYWQLRKQGMGHKEAERKAYLDKEDEKPADKPGIEEAKLSNDNAKAGDQLGLIEGEGQRKAAPKFKTDDKGKAKQMAMIDGLDAGAGQMDFFGGDGTPDDMVYNPDAGKDSDNGVARALAKIKAGGHITTPAQAEFRAMDEWHRLSDKQREQFSGPKEFATAVGKAYQAEQGKQTEAKTELTSDGKIPAVDESQDAKPPEPSPELKSKLEADNKKRPEADRADKEGTPRQQSRAALDETAGDYEFARKSTIGNRGEDLMGSARHKVNAWRSLDEAEKDGTAAEMVTRDNLLKNEPHEIGIHLDSNPIGTLMMHEAMRSFPATPGYGSRSRTADQKKENRAHYLEVYRNVKAKAEAIAKTEDDPIKASKALGEFVSSEIHRMRREYGGYNDTANALCSYANRLHRMHSKNSLVRKVGEFMLAVKEHHGDGGAEGIRKKLIDYTAKALEGKTLTSLDPRKDGKGGQRKPSKFVMRALYGQGSDRKGGRDLGHKTGKQAADYLDKVVGFRGVQWGNSMSDKERDHHAKATAHAVVDLAEIIGLRPEHISLDGKLGIAHGARGIAGAAAHYEPGNKVINMTRAHGAGTFAHEWMHAVDHAMAGGQMHLTHKGGKLVNAGEYMSQNVDPWERTGKKVGDKWVSETKDRTKDPLWSAMDKVRKSWQSSGFHQRMTEELKEMARSGQIKNSGSGIGSRQYYSSNEEMMARSFEAYVTHKLESDGRKNEYLSGATEHPLWPTKEEAAKMAPAFDELFKAYRQNVTGSDEPLKFSAADRQAFIERYGSTHDFIMEHYAPSGRDKQTEFRWITVHPNGPDSKGVPVRINSKDGTIAGGMGGKHNGEKIGALRKQSGPPKALLGRAREALGLPKSGLPDEAIHKYLSGWGSSMAKERAKQLADRGVKFTHDTHERTIKDPDTGEMRTFSSPRNIKIATDQDYESLRKHVEQDINDYAEDLGSMAKHSESPTWVKDQLRKLAGQGGDPDPELIDEIRKHRPELLEDKNIDKWRRVVEKDKSKRDAQEKLRKETNLTRAQLEAMTAPEVKKLARDMGVRTPMRRKAQFIDAVLAATAKDQEPDEHEPHRQKVRDLIKKAKGAGIANPQSKEILDGAQKYLEDGGKPRYKGEDDEQEQGLRSIQSLESKVHRTNMITGRPTEWIHHPTGVVAPERLHGYANEGEHKTHFAIHQTEQTIRKRATESIHAFDENGKVLYEQGGDESSVSIKPSEIGKFRGAIVTHNHPSGWGYPHGNPGRLGRSFSPEDIVFAAFNGVKEMRVISPGYIHTLETGWHNEKMTDADLHQLQKDIAKFKQEVKMEFTAKIDEARKQGAQAEQDAVDIANAEDGHEFSKRLAKELGWTYKRIPINQPIGDSEREEYAADLRGRDEAGEGDRFGSVERFDAKAGQLGTQKGHQLVQGSQGDVGYFVTIDQHPVFVEAKSGKITRGPNGHRGKHVKHVAGKRLMRSKRIKSDRSGDRDSPGQLGAFGNGLGGDLLRGTKTQNRIGLKPSDPPPAPAKSPDKPAKFKAKTAIERQAVELVGDDPDDVAYFRDLMDDAHSMMVTEAQETNDGLRQLLGHFGFSGNKTGLIVRRIRNAHAKGGDADMLARFDQMVDMAKRDIPHLLNTRQGESTGSGDYEHALFERLRKGFEKIPTKTDERVLALAKQMFDAKAPASSSDYDYDPNWMPDYDLPDDYDPFAPEPAKSSDYVPFASSFADAVIERYRAICSLGA